MVRLTQSLFEFLFRFHKNELPDIEIFGHTELFDEKMQEEYFEWLKTDEGRSYLKGGANYKEEDDEEGL